MVASEPQSLVRKYNNEFDDVDDNENSIDNINENVDRFFNNEQNFNKNSVNNENQKNESVVKNVILSNLNNNDNLDSNINDNDDSNTFGKNKKLGVREKIDAKRAGSDDNGKSEYISIIYPLTLYLFDVELVFPSSTLSRIHLINAVGLCINTIFKFQLKKKDVYFEVKNISTQF